MLKKKKILVVEDDRFLSDIYKRQLAEKGHQVEVAVNGKEALEKLEMMVPDVILLDLIMPGMDGFDFLAELRKQPAHEKRRVIVLTNLGQDGDKERCHTLGVKEYFVKTEMSIEDVVNAV